MARQRLDLALLLYFLYVRQWPRAVKVSLGGRIQTEISKPAPAEGLFFFLTLFTSDLPSSSQFGVTISL
jgi:hypothetical protein